MGDIKKICFFDTETVSIKPNYIISLAYRVYEQGKDPVNGIIECNPDFPINPQASKVNGYTDDKVANFPKFDDNWIKIEKHFRDSLWICHNTPFDESAIALELNRYKLPMPHHYTLDTLEMARAFLQPKVDVENHKLETLCRYFNVLNSTTNFHEAGFDVWACEQIYKKFKQCSKYSDVLKQRLVPREVPGDYTRIDPYVPCSVAIEDDEDFPW